MPAFRPAGRQERPHQIKAQQPVITPVQHITLDSDGTNQKNAGRLISSVQPKSNRTAHFADSIAAKLKRQSWTQIGNKTPPNVFRSRRGSLAALLEDFLPHPPSQQKTGRGWLSLPYWRDG